MIRALTVGNKNINMHGRTIIRDWVPPKYAINITQVEGCTITSDYEEAEAGTLITLTYTVDGIHNFQNFAVNGASIVGNTFTMPSEDVTVSAVCTLAPDEMWFQDNTKYPSSTAAKYIPLNKNIQHDFNYFAIRFYGGLGTTGYIDLRNESAWNNGNSWAWGMTGISSPARFGAACVGKAGSAGGPLVVSGTLTPTLAYCNSAYFSTQGASTVYWYGYSGSTALHYSNHTWKWAFDRSGRKAYMYCNESAVGEFDLNRDPIEISWIVKKPAAVSAISVAGFSTLSAAQQYNGTL